MASVANNRRQPMLNTDVMNTIEAARYVRLGKPTLDRFRLTGEGPRFAKLGGAVRYRRADLDDWIASRLVASTSAADLDAKSA
jgi:predicted DNA-binding transcriptional regulator AlpA